MRNGTNTILVDLNILSFANKKHHFGIIETSKSHVLIDEANSG